MFLLRFLKFFLAFTWYIVANDLGASSRSDYLDEISSDPSSSCSSGAGAKNSKPSRAKKKLSLTEQRNTTKRNSAALKGHKKPRAKTPKFPSQPSAGQSRILEFFKNIPLVSPTAISTDIEPEEEELILSQEDFNNSTSSLVRLRKGDPIEEETPSLTLQQDIGPILPTPYFVSSRPYSQTRMNIEDDSDEEEELENPGLLVENKFPNFPFHIISMGTQLKLLSNVYLRNLGGTANVFLPFYKLSEPNGCMKQQDFFRTPKNEICVFASGGFQNVWEKTVEKVYEVFFGQKVKIIRASWIYNHLRKDKFILRDLEEEFQGREHELHSELYYNIFFQNFFLPGLKLNSKGDAAARVTLTVYGYSWWEVCSDCERKYLTPLRSLLAPRGINLSYKIAAMRNYNHSYSEYSAVASARIPSAEEELAWQQIWENVKKYVHKEFEDEEQKDYFWTSTKEGLEICKWLGQAFVENRVNSKGRKAKIENRGNILKFYQAVSGDETQELQELIGYLRECNWELSCWYKKPYPDTVQARWKNYWRQLVVPHFGWERLQVIKLAEGCTDYCQMCGNQGLTDVYWIFHPKHRVSERFYNEFSEEDRKKTELSQGYNSLTPFDKLLPVFQKKRKQCLSVGSECVTKLQLERYEINEWRQEHPDEYRDEKWEELVQREENLEALDQAEKQLAKMKTTKKKRKGSRQERT